MKNVYRKMNNQITKNLVVILLAVICFTGFAAENEEQGLLQGLTRLRHPREDMVCLLSITTYKEKDVISYKEFTFFADGESDQFLLICQSPPAEQGFACIKRKDRIWTYSPLIQTFFTTSGYDILEGTGSRIEDFLPAHYGKDYTVQKSGKTEISGHLAIKLILEASSETAPYHGLVLWFSEKYNFLLKEEAYDSENHLLKRIMYAHYREKDGWAQPASIFVTDIIEGTVTSLQIKKTTLSPIPDYVFTRSFVEFITQ